MHLIYRDFKGVSNVLSVSSNEELLKSISEIEKTDICFKSIRYNGFPLESIQLLQDYSLINVNEELLGGGKKRKKKNYSTPKKIKHKRKKVKLAILKYYKVDSNGKITRLRRDCPNSNCGAGVFMANHFNRQYCGKCNNCYMLTGK